MTAKLLAFAGDKAGYLTPTEAAEWLPYTPKTIREMCSPDHPLITHIDRNTNHARSA